MVNVLYDFTNAFGPGITPYVGAGFGWQYDRITNLVGPIEPAEISAFGSGPGARDEECHSRAC